MGRTLKSQIAKAVQQRPDLDKKAVQISKSWNEVDSLLKSINKGNNKKK